MMTKWLHPWRRFLGIVDDFIILQDNTGPVFQSDIQKNFWIRQDRDNILVGREVYGFTDPYHLVKDSKVLLPFSHSHKLLVTRELTEGKLVLFSVEQDKWSKLDGKKFSDLSFIHEHFPGYWHPETESREKSHVALWYSYSETKELTFPLQGGWREEKIIVG